MTETLSLQYALTHLSALGLDCVQPRWLWWLAILPLLPLASWRWRGGRLRTAILRSAALACVVAALAGVEITFRLPDDRMALIALVDRSQSIDGDGRAWQRRHLAEVQRALAPGDRLEVVLFGAESRVLDRGVLPNADGDVGLADGATDISAALDRGLALAESANVRRIVLLSDGHETRGNAVARVAQAQSEKVPIFSAAPPQAGGVDAAIDKLSLPRVATVGSLFAIQVVISNHGRQRPASLSMTVDGQRMGEQALTLQPGLNAVEIPYRIEAVGTHEIAAHVVSDGDRIAANNSLTESITIVDELRALLVSHRARSVIEVALARQGISVSHGASLDEMLADQDLSRFNVVILEDIDAGQLSARGSAVLEEFVRDRGGALLFIGGEASFGDPALQKTALTRLLPVTMEPSRPRRPQRPPLGLFLLIDRSNSMGYHFLRGTERSTDDSKLVYARRAALAVLAQLRDNDMIGVIAFDAVPHELGALRPVAEARVDLERDIPRLEADGGTDFYEALASAADQLAGARVANRHIILLTDGDTNRSEGHDDLIDRLSSGGVTVTTIRIGDDQANLKLLTMIAERTGGQFYQVRNADALPELMLRDTGQALSRIAERGEVYPPRVRQAAQLLSGIEESEIPDLYNYAFARPKPGADIVLAVATQDRFDPLLAVWQFGLGRVGAFTASLYEDASSWIAWQKLAKLWSQTVRWAARDQRQRDYAVQVVRAGGETVLEVRSFADHPDAVLWARLQVDDEQRLDLSLQPAGARFFRAHCPKLAPGTYQVSIVERLGARDVSEQTHLVRVPEGDQPPREEQFAEQPNTALLRQLAEKTGGQLNPPISALTERAPGSRVAHQSLDWLWAPLAVVLFLCELALRHAERA